MDTPRRQLLDDGAPPPVRTGPSKPLLILTCGGIVAALLLIVILNIDQEPRGSKHLTDEQIIELIAPPSPLTDADLAQAGDRMQPLRAQRGWIQTHNSDGTPAQRYRCEALDPAPDGMGPGWLEMTQPRMEIFSDDRIISIAGDTAFTYAPQRAVEQGTVTGNVVVRVFDYEPGQPIDPEHDEPAMTMHTAEASFENFLGEISAGGGVLIEGPNFTMPGDRLSILIDDQHDEVRITLAKVEYIRFVREDRERSTRSYSSARSAQGFYSRTASLAASRSEPSSGGSHSADAADSRFYLLTLQDNVRIDEGTRAARRTASGDRLELIFTSKSESLDSPLAFLPPSITSALAHSSAAPSPAARRSFNLRAALTAMTLGSLSPVTQPRAGGIESLLGENITLVRAGGPLTIQPLRDSSRALARAEDARLELTGRPVQLCDFGKQSQALGRTLVYQTDRGVIELVGSPGHPLRVNTPEMEAGGERFYLAQLDAEGGFDGDGWMSRRDRADQEWFALACAADDPLPQRVARREAPPEPREEPELHITWEGGVDLQFDDEGDRISNAHFKGAVNITSPEFNMTADQMAVAFAEQGGSDAIESVHATGDVNVTGMLERSAIRCADLQLNLQQTTAGKTIPKMLVATGDVLAFDEEQTIWADALRVSFRESTAALDDAEAEDEGMGGLLRGRGADVEDFIAERNVQVILADGTRVFADRLSGNGVSETIELTSPDIGSVAVVSDRMIIDQARRITLDRRKGVASVPGAGQFRLFQNQIMPQREVNPDERPSRVERPAIDDEKNPMEVRARWLREMLFHNQANDGAGSIDLRGDVSVMSDPSPTEHNTMTGDALTLEFAFVIGEGRRGEGAEERRKDEESEGRKEHVRLLGDAQPIVGGRQRQLAMLVARQDAKIESQSWDSIEARDADAEPRIFYVAGHHVEYHALTGEALVVGDGHLLIHDVAPVRAGDDPAPFGAKGSTMLTWDGKLELKRRLDNIFDLIATRNVRLRHRDLDEQISTVMCDELAATAVRGSEEARRGDLDFGGSAELERVRAAGTVEIVTDHRTINCGEFDYNVGGGVAQLVAAADRDITIRTAGSAFPMHAQRAVWNMRRDTINITQGRGRQ